MKSSIVNDWRKHCKDTLGSNYKDVIKISETQIINKNVILIFYTCLSLFSLVFCFVFYFHRTKNYT
nr:MAG: hypothetical protein [Porcellio scaber clopovirus]